MTDAEFVFRETSRERKRNGIGTFHKKRRGGKYVRLPSENLSKKEREAMNGEVKTYCFKTPISWQEFLKLPDDMKQEYLDTICEKFPNVPNEAIYTSMGCKKSMFSPYLSKRGLRLSRSQKMTYKVFLETEAGLAWTKWHENSGKPIENNNKSVEATPVEAAPVEVIPDEASVCVGDIDKIAELIRGLAGTGAKITIELVL